LRTREGWLQPHCSVIPSISVAQVGQPIAVNDALRRCSPPNERRVTGREHSGCWVSIIRRLESEMRSRDLV
jgi:hypothetical protein